MNAFEQALLNALTQTALNAIPVFVHSPTGIAIANISEEFLLLFTQGLAAGKPAPAPTPAPLPNPPQAASSGSSTPPA